MHLDDLCTLFFLFCFAFIVLSVGAIYLIYMEEPVCPGITLTFLHTSTSHLTSHTTVL